MSTARINMLGFVLLMLLGSCIGASAGSYMGHRIAAGCPLWPL